MAERVFFHVGVPKSGTTYLQTLLWRHREELARQGVVLPGRGRSDHAVGSFVVREDPHLSPHAQEYPTAWDRILADVGSWDGTAVISHEFYGSATAEQAARALAALAPAEVHLVVTARDALSLLTASWQEALKYREVTPLSEFNQAVSASPLDVWNWRNVDVSEVLSRWAVDLAPKRVHVVVTPRQRSTQPVLWHRFAGLFCDDPEVFDLSDAAGNESMGVVEAELLRRVSPHLSMLSGGPGVRTWVRDYLAGSKLVSREGERFLPSPRRVQECRSRSEQMVQRLSSGGYHVVGDLEDLLVPADLPALRSPADVTEAEIADAATELLAELLLGIRSTQLQLRSARRRQRQLRRRLAAQPGPAVSGSAAGRAVLHRVMRAVRRA